jgi:hypothetical protein
MLHSDVIVEPELAQINQVTIAQAFQDSRLNLRAQEHTSLFSR